MKTICDSLQERLNTYGDIINAKLTIHEDANGYTIRYNDNPTPLTEGRTEEEIIAYVDGFCDTILVF